MNAFGVDEETKPNPRVHVFEAERASRAGHQQLPAVSEPDLNGQAAPFAHNPFTHA